MHVFINILVLILIIILVNVMYLYSNTASTSTPKKILKQWYLVKKSGNRVQVGWGSGEGTKVPHIAG